MTSPGGDAEYPGRLWVPPHTCAHPCEQINFSGYFPPENPNLSVFIAHCFQCGSTWDQNDTDAPWDQLLLKIAQGKFGVISAADPDIASKVEWNRQTRYDEIMRDVAGESRAEPRD